MPLNFASLDYPQRLLVLDILNEKRSQPISYEDLLFQNVRLSRAQLRTIDQKLALLAAGYPLDYLLSRISFLHLKVKVPPKVFIPRPETEEWVTRVQDQLRSSNQTTTTAPKTTSTGSDSRAIADLQPPTRSQSTESLQKRSPKRPLLVDLGCGTGVIGLSLANYYQQVVLVDICPIALASASFNCRQNGINNARLLQASRLAGPRLKKILQTSPTWDLVSNPPYVPTSDLADRVTNKIAHEPVTAIFSGSDGLDFFRSLLQQMADLPLPRNIWLELDPRNIRAAQKLLQQIYPHTEIWPDSSNLERVLVAAKTD